MGREGSGRGEVLGSQGWDLSHFRLQRLNPPGASQPGEEEGSASQVSAPAEGGERGDPVEGSWRCHGGEGSYLKTWGRRPGSLIVPDYSLYFLLPLIIVFVMTWTAHHRSQGSTHTYLVVVHGSFAHCFNNGQGQVCAFVVLVLKGPIRRQSLGDTRQGWDLQ